MTLARLPLLGCAAATIAMAIVPALASARIYQLPSEAGETPLQKIQSVRGNISPRRGTLTRQLVRAQVLKDRKMRQGLSVEDVMKRRQVRVTRQRTPVRTPTAGVTGRKDARYETQDLNRRTQSFLNRMKDRMESDETQRYGREYLSR